MPPPPSPTPRGPRPIRDEETAPERGRSEPADRGGALMVRWQRGDEGAFDEIVDLYSGQVFALLTRFLGRSHPAREDLVQEVFLRVVRARDRYEPTAKFSTWLYSIVWRMCINETERTSGRIALSLDADPSTRGDGARRPDPVDRLVGAPGDGLERADIVQAVRRAIAGLPESQRIALVLARYHDQPYAEIAAIVGSTEKAVKSLIHRARETLRVELRSLFESEVA